MYWLRKLQGLRALWGTQMPSHALHINNRQLVSVQWGHLEVQPTFNFARDVIDHWAEMEKVGKRPPDPALWWVNGNGEEVMWNFRELSEISQQAANVLSEACGLQRGDRVAVVLPQVPEWGLVILGCIRAGLVFMPGTIQMKSTDILYRLQMSKAKAIVAGDEVFQEVDTVASKCPSLRIKLLVSEKSWDGWLNFKKLLKEASTTHRCVVTGSQEPSAIYFTSGTSGLPKMAEHSHSSLGLKAKLDAGWTGLQASDVAWTIADTGWIVYIACSLESWATGACTFVRLLPKFDPLVILKVIDDKGNVLPPGEEGDIGIRVKPIKPIGIFSGYVDNPEKTAANIRGDFWLLGDQGIKDEDGYFQFLGRADDIINSSGYRIGPSEVENALMEHPAVVEAAVISSPDPIRGQVVKAFVVLASQFLSHDPEQLTKELQQHVKSVTAPYKYPRKIEFVLNLPKSVTGKIQRAKLRDKEWKKSGQARAQ
ncbi:acyl-coenzyme A synthetase ACSM2A, mitochondrial isoform X2 [Saimiri boliviensis]|uniref:acyl-coenzyme A synthetase ACSM2A, mitochondrial isoform X2 n=1 Tax=Saimiri boliviensis TaxID=27679 RepID=UPI000533D752|nr:acyl-coenzyme A synthetase ACSM2A, mitochondrial isoform X2 [Saimiri boliviensis boliviensis]